MGNIFGKHFAFIWYSASGEVPYVTHCTALCLEESDKRIYVLIFKEILVPNVYLDV